MISDQESAAAMVPAAENNSARPSAVVETPEGNNPGVDGYDVGLMDDLLSALSSIKAPGSFASFGVLPQPPPAGLFVDDVGDITMPLSEVQARQLIAKARQAPYGKGSATIIDTAVRNTWELDSGQFRFQSPHWPGFMRHLCAQVALNLGINAPITAQIYKMLIYEKGAMFKAHTDTEKIPGMFGTLVICLPSAHQGGEVVLKHCGQRKVFKTSEAPQSFASWYSDVSHEVLPVTSGFRWVLTYNLALNLTGPGPSAGLQQFETGALRRTLKRWLSEPKGSRETNCVYHVLDHDYTEANISLKALKTRDLAQVHALKEISGELAVDVFLALLEKEEMGSCEHDPYEDRYDGFRRYNRSYYDDDDDGYDDYNDDESGYHHLEEVFETKYAVKTLVDLQGRVVATRLRLDEQDILQEDCFEDLEAEEEYEGYMGNSGPTATHWYRVTFTLYSVDFHDYCSHEWFFRTPYVEFRAPWPPNWDWDNDLLDPAETKAHGHIYLDSDSVSEFAAFWPPRRAGQLMIPLLYGPEECDPIIQFISDEYFIMTVRTDLDIVANRIRIRNPEATNIPDVFHFVGIRDRQLDKCDTNDKFDSWLIGSNKRQAGRNGE